jgi:bifunctional non-homologous end joining protein LigD
LDSRDKARRFSYHCAEKGGCRAELHSQGLRFHSRFPKITEAVAGLSVRSCVIDDEAVVVDERGLSVFDALRYWLSDHAVVLCAFDLIEFDGEDLRWARLENRKRGKRNGTAADNGL